MKKIMFILLMVTFSTSILKADEVGDLEKVVGAVYDRIPDAEYFVTFWLSSGQLEYKPCGSCEEARRVAYSALYEGVATQVQVTSTYPTVQTGCWNMIKKKIFTRSNMNDLL